jgi:uncharacterized protein YbbC (DUF1343 family)
LTCFHEHPDLRLGAIFGPQHGLFGQTQDNMVEWEGFRHPWYDVPVFSLYGAIRKPTPRMLDGLDALLIDLQDVGARPYTYIWTVKLCMEACMEKQLPLWILDRPNPIAAVPFDGPMLSENWFSFVGGASIPLCHRLTIGEMALLMRQEYFSGLELQVISMEGWWRNSLWPETGLPWVLPSPNMPSLDTALVYPGQVLLEATTLSEGRGTTRPFELFGAPGINCDALNKYLESQKLPGCYLREHHFIPTFQKWQGKYCDGFQIHVLDPRTFQPVLTTVAILAGILRQSSASFAFKDPPYEYETEKMPFDILAGDDRLRKGLQSGGEPREMAALWASERFEFERNTAAFSRYREERE